MAGGQSTARCAARLVGRRRLDADARLPAHYHGIELALLEECRASGDDPGDAAADRA